jgi:hypothetical protein
MDASIDHDSPFILNNPGRFTRASVEGETELFLFPRLMEFFGIRKDRDFIAIENAQGVGRDISTPSFK